MIAVVYSVPRDGPVQVWLIPISGDSTEPPTTAAIPGLDDPGTLAFTKYKGEAVPWLDWAQELADSPWLGDWSIQEVPDTDALGQPMAAQGALGYVRMHMLERNLGV